MCQTILLASSTYLCQIGKFKACDKHYEVHFAHTMQSASTHKQKHKQHMNMH
jgi:hypothetical protein